MIESEFFRKKLHKLAELSGKEVNTSKLLFDDLSLIDAFEIKRLANHSLLASFGSKGGIMLRADIDALPIDESHLGIAHESANSKVSHKCGHDGHSAILRTLAHRIKLNSQFVHLLFQESEENAQGAPAVIRDLQFQAVKPDFAFGMHNIPGRPLAEVLVKKGTITAAVTTLIILIDGISAHASSPEKGISPIPLITKLIEEAKRLEIQVNKNIYALITPVFIQVGDESNGISPGKAQINFTIRCYNNKELNKICEMLRTFAKNEAFKLNLKINTREEDKFEACDNNDEAVEMLLDAASRAGLKINIMQDAFPFGEDFGSYSQVIPSCFFGLGAGENQPPLHHPDYDFPDELTPHAVNLWQCLLDTNLTIKEK